jgi:hypothetical protein
MSDRMKSPGEAARRRALMAMVVLVGGLTASPGAEGQAPSGRGFSEVLAANLPAWTGGSGAVEKRRLEALAADPTIRGEDAAALAALLRQFRKATTTSLPTAELDGADRPGLDANYRALVAKLGKVNRSLFAAGKPNFARMKQGPAGDCYLFSGAGWWAYTMPRRIVEMIQPLPDDHYLVLFPDGEQVIVTAPTDTELACNESISTAADGIWMAVLEKAVGTLDYYRDAKTRAVADPSLRVNLGGSPRADVRRWTGNAVDSYRLRDPARQPAVRDALVAMAGRRLMAQAVVLKSDGPAPIPTDHAYAVLGFDPKTDVLTVWNPWGDDFTPRGPAGAEHGWPRRHGVFQVPLADFVRVFSTLDVERR